MGFGFLVALSSADPLRHGAGLKPGTKPIVSMRLIAKVPAKEHANAKELVVREGSLGAPQPPCGGMGSRRKFRSGGVKTAG